MRLALVVIVALVGVLVTLGGGIRMCDAAKALSASTPDGCP